MIILLFGVQHDPERVEHCIAHNEIVGYAIVFYEIVFYEIVGYACRFSATPNGVEWHC